MSTVRDPILDYATYNPVPDYIPPVNQDEGDHLITKAGLTLVTKDGDALTIKD